MLADSPAPINRMSVEQSIRQRILQRTWHRIRSLTVNVSAGGVSVRGYVSSYYIKQLALLGVREAIGAKNPTQLELDIRVQPCHTRSDGGDEN